ncbi:CheB methylesterase domain-containing protein [Thomasclavelia sp.]
MNDLHVILYQKDVKDNAYISTLLMKDKSFLLHKFKSLENIKQYIDCCKVHCIIYECDLFNNDNVKEIKKIEKYQIPYLIITASLEKTYNIYKDKIIIKPNSTSLSNVFFDQLSVRIKFIKPFENLEIKKNMGRVSTNIIGIGASAGGPRALCEILKVFSADTCGTIVVQHMSDNNIMQFAQYLDKLCKVTVKVAQENEIVRDGVVYIAKQKQHLIIKREKDGFHLHYIDGIKVNCVCPSIDVMFYSLAKQAGMFSIGVLLTGMGKDGAVGLKKMKDLGAFTIIQNKETSELYSMPFQAKKINGYHQELAIQDIGAYLVQYLKNKRKEE